jgi:hypothetical protein
MPRDERSSTKLQITVDKNVADILRREADERKTRNSTYAAIILSECVLKREKEGW